MRILNSFRQQPVDAGIYVRLVTQLPWQPRRLSRESRNFVCGPQTRTLHDRPTEALVLNVGERLRDINGKLGGEPPSSDHTPGTSTTLTE